MDDGLVEDQSSGLLEFVKGLIAVYAAIAALFYLILRLAYFQFYGRLGVLPEEVGIGRTELLSQALAGPAALFLLTTAFGVIIFAITFFISMVFSLAILGLSAIASASGRKVPWTERRQVLAAIEERGMREYIRRLGRLVKPVLAVSILFAFFTAFIGPIFGASYLGREVKDRGLIVDPLVRDFGPVLFPLLDIRAVPIDLHSKDDDKRLLNTECRLYLGESKGIAVIYDVRTAEVVHFPLDGVVETLGHGRRLFGCTPPS